MKYFAKIYTPIPRGKKALRTMGEGDEAILNLPVSFAQVPPGTGLPGALRGLPLFSKPSDTARENEDKEPCS